MTMLFKHIKFLAAGTACGVVFAAIISLIPPSSAAESRYAPLGGEQEACAVSK